MGKNALKFLIVLSMVLLINTPVFADEYDMQDGWDAITTQYSDAQMTNPVTDKQFNEALDTLQKFKEKKEKKVQGNKLIPKGLRDKAQEIEDKKKKEPSTPMDYPENLMPLLRLPSAFILTGSTINAGYYLTAFKQKDKKYYVQLFQSNQLIAEIEVFPIEYTTFKNDIKIDKYNEDYAVLLLENNIAKFKTYLKYNK